MTTPATDLSAATGAVPLRERVFGGHEREALATPIVDNNPIGVQVLGICSALAVTTRMDKALVMGIGVTIVTASAEQMPSTCTPIGLLSMTGAASALRSALPKTFIAGARAGRSGVAGVVMTSCLRGSA